MSHIPTNAPTPEQMRQSFQRLEKIRGSLFDIWVQFIEFQGPGVDAARKRNFFDKNYHNIMQNFLRRFKIIDHPDEEIEEFFGDYMEKWYNTKIIKRNHLLIVENPKRYVLAELTTYLENPENKFILQKIRKNFDTSRIGGPPHSSQR